MIKWNKIYKAEEVPIKVAKFLEVILFPNKIPWVFHKKSHFSGEFFLNVSISMYAKDIYLPIF